jgi:hypothetical protein
VAFLSFFLVFLVIGIQTWADALFVDQRIEIFPAALLMLPVGLLMRSYFLYVMFIHQSTHSPVFPANQILAPEFLIISTCVISKTLHVLGRVSYLWFASR